MKKPRSQLSVAGKTSNSKADAVDHGLSKEELLKLLDRLRNRVEQLPDFDSARIVELYDRVSSGSYEVDNAGLAEKLLRFEESLK